MESINFECLRPHYSELADLGALAEAYAHSDPPSALVKLRSIVEHMVSTIYSRHRLNRPYQFNLYDMLGDDSFRSIVPRVVVDKFHAIRVNGNKAAHSSGTMVNLTTNLVLYLIREAYDLAKWFLMAFENVPQEKIPEYVEIRPREDSKRRLRKERDRVSEQLQEKEAQLNKVLAELESSRARVQSATLSAQDQQQLLFKTQAIANQLSFDEETTRRNLIDQLLRAAGWNVGLDGASNEEVGQECKVDHQPTKTGEGYADYVLWDDNGKPLAVVEAKKTSRDAAQGKIQAAYYADGLEKMTGQRPVIFYTNGYEVFLWNDGLHEPPRRLFGFYSKDSLQYLIHQRAHRKDLQTLGPKKEIVDRMYQLEAIKRVTERFANRHRKALLVLATGTGKTRIAVALSELLLRSGWVRRILFLCDRRELRKQAFDVFKEYLTEPITYLTRDTYEDKNYRIYLSTYPAAMQCFENFDMGFFDLIIADESHRSIYNRYRELFQYFDAYQVGLTATPIGFGLIHRNTFRLFDCENDDPTFNFTLEEAISHHPPYLVPFEVLEHTTKFLREGIKYREMNEDQREELEDQVEDPEAIDYEKEKVSKQVFNKDTDRKILQNLMDNGIMNAEGSHPGKTIIFARNHQHALQLNELFDEMYKQYGGKLCQVIDHYEPRAEQLINDFKSNDPQKKLTIAISVDMLDTGIDVPEIVNLVFAKPVRSYVKFWQMIGRGTRLCPNLFGPSAHKTRFCIFDHWGNFEWFGTEYEEKEPPRTKSLRQILFEARIRLAEKGREEQKEVFALARELLSEDIEELPSTIAVKEKWKEVEQARDKKALEEWSPFIQSILKSEVAPLMKWINLDGEEAAFRFDLLMANLEDSLMKKGSHFTKYKAALLQSLSELPENLDQVRAVIGLIDEIKKPDFWKEITVQKLEEVRISLRPLMKYRRTPSTQTLIPVIDVTDGEIRTTYPPAQLHGMDLVAYRGRVEKVLVELFVQIPTLQKIKEGKAVTPDEIKELADKILLYDPELRLNDLLVHYPNQKNRLDIAIRQIIGLEAEKVNELLTGFVQKHPQLSSHQIRFLDLLKKQIGKTGAINIDALWEQPFTSLHNDGVSGLFDEDQIDDLLAVLGEINEFIPSE